MDARVGDDRERDGQARDPAHAGAPASGKAPAAGQAPAETGPRRVGGLRFVPVLVTLGVVAVAALLGWAVWDAYLIAPWTRDGTVRAYVVTEASEVSGRLVQLPVRADGFVTKGQLLMEIEPTDYTIAVANAEATVEQAKASLVNAQANATRRAKLTTLSTSEEEKENYETSARTADATLRRDLADLAQARVNLQRTRIVSPVNGFVTNLTAQLGDYVTVGERVISVVNSDSFWLDGYFEETQLAGIRIGATARMYLMGWRTPLWGHVAGIARGIEVPNAQPDAAGLASVDPTFTWIRLAQRIPVRIEIDQVPPGIVLVAGMTATIQIDPHTGRGDALLHALTPWRHGAGDTPGPAPDGVVAAGTVAPGMVGAGVAGAQDGAISGGAVSNGTDRAGVSQGGIAANLPPATAVAGQDR